MIAARLTWIAASPWMRAALRYGAIVVAILLFLLSLRTSGERTERLAERLETTEKTNEIQCRIMEAAARCPRNRGELVNRLSDHFWLTDAQMARLKPFFPKSHGKPRVDDRRVLSGIIFINRSGCDGVTLLPPMARTRRSTAGGSVGAKKAFSRG